MIHDIQVPLQAESYELNGREVIEMWINGEKKIVDPPFWPYFIVKNNAIEWEKVGEYRAERVIVKPITTLEPIAAMKYSFPSVSPIQQLNYGQLKEMEKDGKSPIVENHLRFIERVCVDQPDFFKQYPNMKNDIFVFDIETLTENHVPKDNIIAIAISDGDEIFYEDVTGGTSEAYLLEWFVDHWRRIDPDHIVGYNHKGFDIPRILKRCLNHNIPIDWVGRDGDAPPLTGKYRLDEGIIRGRCVFDVWESVDSDQTLLGNIKNNRLKTVAKYRGIPAIEEELSNTIELLKDPPRLRRYNESDVLATLKLYAGYMYEHSTVANLIGFPYDEIINPKGARRGKEKTQKGRAREGITTLIGRIAGARGMGHGGFVEDGKNRDRYPDIFYDQSHLKPAERQPYYQGAIVGLFKDGQLLEKDEVLGEMYAPTMHADYAGMYPSIQMECNISPETTKLLAMEPYDLSVWPDGLVRDRGPNHTVFVIPDKNLCRDGRNAVIYVDQSFEGSIPKWLRLLKEKRQGLKDLKAQAVKDLDTEGQLKYQSGQYGLKVAANATGYGSNVRPETRYGSEPCGILITGLSRLMLVISQEFIVEWKG